MSLRPTYPTPAEREASKQLGRELLCKPIQGQRGVMGGATKGPLPKSRPTRDEAYRRAVSKLPCVNCCIVGHSQAAHPNTGKGLSMKADDRDCFPLCADRPGVRGCHSRFDQGALFDKVKRREMEVMWAAQTRAVIEGMML